MKNILKMLIFLVSHKLKDPILSCPPHPICSLWGQLIVADALHSSCSLRSLSELCQAALVWSLTRRLEHENDLNPQSLLPTIAVRQLLGVKHFHNLTKHCSALQ